MVSNYLQYDLGRPDLPIPYKPVPGWSRKIHSVNIYILFDGLEKLSRPSNGVSDALTESDS